MKKIRLLPLILAISLLLCITAPGAAALMLALAAGMESLLYILIRFQSRIYSVWGSEGYDALTVICTTPVRWFLNTELLMMRSFQLESAFNSLTLLNILLRPSYFTIFIIPAVCLMTVSVLLCYTYQRR